MKSSRLEQLQQMLADNPEDPFLLYALAQEFLNNNETEKALVWFKNLTEKHPDYTGTYYHLGKLYEHLGETDKAIETYNIGLKATARLGDRHNHSELQGALANLED